VTDTEAYARLQVMVEDVLLMKAWSYNLLPHNDAKRQQWQQRVDALQTRVDRLNLVALLSACILPSHPCLPMQFFVCLRVHQSLIHP